MAERKRRLLHRLSQLPRGDAFPLQVVLWRMGDAFWLGVQGESYSLLQTELRRRFPGTPISGGFDCGGLGRVVFAAGAIIRNGHLPGVHRGRGGGQLGAVDRVDCGPNCSGASKVRTD